MNKQDSKMNDETLNNKQPPAAKRPLKRLVMRFSLEFYRHMRGMSQSDLARKSGVTASAISMLEAKTRKPSLDIAAKLAIALDVTLNELSGLSPPTSTGELREKVVRLEKALMQINDLSA